jgi:hypothetical protein
MAKYSHITVPICGVSSNNLSGARSVTLSCYRSGQLGAGGRMGSNFAAMLVDVIVVHRFGGKCPKSGFLDAVRQALIVIRICCI